MKQALSEAAVPRGFRFSATACGLKKTGALDLALLSSDVPASAAAVFTQNLVVAAPVVVSKKNLRASKGRMRAVIVNAGNANCATGEAGYAASVRMVEETARRLGCQPQEVLVCSTGVIGVPLALEKVLASAVRNHAKSPPVGALVCRTLPGNLHDRHAPENGRQFVSAWRASGFTSWVARRVRG